MEIQKGSNDQMTSCKRIEYFVSYAMVRRVMDCVEYCGVKMIIYLAVFWFKPIKYAFKKSDYFEWTQSHKAVTHLGRNKLAKISDSSASIDLHAKVNSIIFKNSLNLHKSLADGTALPNLNKLVMFQFNTNHIQLLWGLADNEAQNQRLGYVKIQQRQPNIAPTLGGSQCETNLWTSQR